MIMTSAELYPRRQIGVVLQDTLLFKGTVQSIALTNPDATSEEILRRRNRVAHDFIMPCLMVITVESAVPPCRADRDSELRSPARLAKPKVANFR